MAKKKSLHESCPNPECSAAWGIEEVSFQECDTCGWPDVDESGIQRSFGRY